MKKSVKIIVALCLMAALVLTLAACGDDNIGTWECTNCKELLLLSSAAQGFSKEKTEEMLGRSLDDLSLTVTFNKDKTCTVMENLWHGPEEFTGTWTSDEKGINVTVNGYFSFPFLRDGDNLTTISYRYIIGNKDHELVFAKK